MAYNGFSLFVFLTEIQYTKSSTPISHLSAYQSSNKSNIIKSL